MGRSRKFEAKGRSMSVASPAAVLVTVQGYMVLDTCAVQPHLAISTNAGALITSGAELDEKGTEVLTIAGGEYRLCWCAAGFACSAANDFVVDVGAFSVIGIRCSDSDCLTDRTCVSGQPCNVDGIQGLHLTALDRIAILDTCGEQGLPHMMGNLDDSAYTVRSVTWQSDYLTVGGGIYKLCWCSGSFECSLSEDFRVDAGDLTILGPAPTHQHRTCISGQNCILEGFVVESPTNADSVIVLQTCGALMSAGKSTSIGLSSLSHVVATLGTSGASIDFGSSFATAAGGVYRLCWCSGHFGCQLPSDFRVQLGELTLLGMSPLFQDKTCISGQTCTIHGLLGQDLSDASRVMVLDSCGTAELVPKLVLDGLATGVTDNGASVTWGSVPMTPPGGKYRLCWCAEQSNSTNLTWSARCKDPLNFAQDVGTMTLVGASPLRQDFTCVVGSLCSVRAVSGEGLSAADSVMLLDTCGTGNIPDRFPVDSNISNISNNALRYMTGPYFNIIWQTAITAPGGQYRLCWCSSAAPCSTAEHFRLDFGSLTLAGPSPLLQHHTCTAGRSCARPAVAVYPRDLDVGEVVVLSTCSYQSSWAPDGFPHRGQLLANTSELVTAGGGHYTLCWNPARDSSNRTVDADIGEFQTTPGPQLSLLQLFVPSLLLCYRVPSVLLLIWHFICLLTTHAEAGPSLHCGPLTTWARPHLHQRPYLLPLWLFGGRPFPRR